MSQNNSISQTSPSTLLNTPISSENSELNSILLMMEKLLHWAAIIDSSDDAIISKSIDGYITSWNKGAQRLYGYKPEEIIGKPVSVLMPQSKKDDFPFIMAQLHEGKRVEHYETQRVTKDGRIIHVSITVSPIRNSQGTIIGASKIARDITDRFELERRREEFVSIASHELKTPITSQKAFGELLEQMIEKNNHDQYLPYIKKINQQTNKLTRLVEDLLELSRVETGKLKISSNKFNFDELVDEIVENIQMTTSHQIVKKGQTNKNIQGDRERVGQVFTNILSNAIKYSPKANQVLIDLNVEEDSVCVTVEDFGIGIDSQYQDKVFERFFRVDGEDEKTYPGMGIGLHVCKEIITNHNGKIWLESQKGKGSKFIFCLPCVKPDCEEL